MILQKPGTYHICQTFGVGVVNIIGRMGTGLVGSGWGNCTNTMNTMALGGMDSPEKKCFNHSTYILWRSESPFYGSLVYHPMQCEAVVDVQEKRFPLKTTSLKSSFQVWR